MGLRAIVRIMRPKGRNEREWNARAAGAASTLDAGEPASWQKENN